MELIITDSARKHRIADADQLHAYLHVVRVFDLDEDSCMFIGPSRAGSTLLEIGVVGAADSRIVIVHAMIARSKFLR